MKQLRERTGILLLAMMASLALVAVGCGDDDDDKKPVMDSGTPDGGGEEDGGVDPAVQACIDAQPDSLSHMGVDQGFSQGCAQCNCECDAEAFDVCDEDCWLLTKCIYAACDSDREDQACIQANCGAYIGAADLEGAMDRVACLSGDADCGAASCSGFFLSTFPVDQPDDDAGVDAGPQEDAGVDAGADAGDAG